MKNQNASRTRSPAVVTLSRGVLAVVDGGAAPPPQSEAPPAAAPPAAAPPAAAPKPEKFVAPAKNYLDMQWKQQFGEDSVFPGAGPKPTIFDRMAKKKKQQQPP